MRFEAPVRRVLVAPVHGGARPESQNATREGTWLELPRGQGPTQLHADPRQLVPSLFTIDIAVELGRHDAAESNRRLRAPLLDQALLPRRPRLLTHAIDQGGQPHLQQAVATEEAISSESETS